VLHPQTFRPVLLLHLAIAATLDSFQFNLGRLILVIGNDNTASNFESIQSESVAKVEHSIAMHLPLRIKSRLNQRRVGHQQCPFGQHSLTERVQDGKKIPSETGLVQFHLSSAIKLKKANRS